MVTETNQCEAVKGSQANEEIKTNFTEKKESPSGCSELDVCSEEFDPLRALYASEYRISTKLPKVQYQNLAAFESALKTFGILKLNKRNNKVVTSVIATASGDKSSVAAGSTVPSSSLQDGGIGELKRRFLSHILPITLTKQEDENDNHQQRHKRNLFTQMKHMKGPLAQLHKWVMEHKCVRVTVRREHGVRGHIDGQLICFDKHWNLILIGVTEVWQRRKFKYGENKFWGLPQDCSDRLDGLGIKLPQQHVKSKNRKNVEIVRQLPQLCIRGEQVIIVVVLA